MFVNAYKEAYAALPLTECKGDDDSDLEPIFDAIERSEVECDALHIIAGTLAAKMNFLDESLGSKDPEIPLKSQSHLQELIDSGFLESIKLRFTSHFLALDFDLQIILSFRSPFSTLRFCLEIRFFAKQNCMFFRNILYDFSISSFESSLKVF